MPTELYNAPDNRSLWQRIKYNVSALLTSRVDTLKQSDAVTDMLMDKLTEACKEAHACNELTKRYAALCLQQHEALVLAEVQLWDDNYCGEERERAHKAVADAIAASAAIL